MKIENLDKVNSLYNFYQVKKNDYENLKKAIKDKECFTLESESIYQTTSSKLTDCYGGKERLEHMKTGKLVKGKVHCSCYMCSPKSKTHGLKHSDKKMKKEG